MAITKSEIEKAISRYEGYSHPVLTYRTHILCVAVLYSTIILTVSGEKKIAPRKRTGPKHYWNTLNVQIVESGIATLTELKIQTGVSPGMGRVMLIKKIICSINGFDLNAVLAPGAGDALIMCLSTNQDAAAMPGLQDNGTIWYHAPLHEAGGDGATAAESPSGFTYMGGFPPYVEFDDPIPVADNEISLYIEGVALSTAVTAGLKIYYAVDTVTLNEALTILESYR